MAMTIAVVNLVKRLPCMRGVGVAPAPAATGISLKNVLIMPSNKLLRQGSSGMNFKRMPHVTISVTRWRTLTAQQSIVPSIHVRQIFAAIRQKWSRLHMNEILSRGMNKYKE